jgi:hypothetical protein
VLARRLPGFGDAIHPSPAADDSLDVGGGARLRHVEERRLRVGRGDARDRADLRIRHFAAGKGLRDERKGAEGARHDSQVAHELKPVFQPARSSNSRIRSRSCAVAASRCADSSAI